MKTARFSLCGLTLALLASAVLLPKAHAITIAHGGDSVDIDFVDIGAAGYAADFNGYGAVNYDYKIGTFEVTAQQWAAVSSFDANVEDTVNDPWSGLQPTANVSWFEAAKFANWLTSGDALQGAYQFSDATTFTGIDRNAAWSTYGSIYVLPNEDEWYKASYLQSDFITWRNFSSYGDDGFAGPDDADYDQVYSDNADYELTAPLAVGGGMEEWNGTYDMSGNVREWTETTGFLINGLEGRVARGPYFKEILYGGSPTLFPQMSSYDSVEVIRVGGEFDDIGFRVAQIVPEPSSVGLLVIGAMGCVLRRKR